MIPKIIHYSWISGDPYPENIQRCIDTWKEKLPDYQFINWNRDTFDFNSCRWLQEAHESKNYAYSSDYLRVYAVYNYGGIWLDTDVEVLKSFNDLLSYPYFIGEEARNLDIETSVYGIEAATMGFEKKHILMGTILNWYNCNSYNEHKDNIFDNTLPKIMFRTIKYLYKNINNNIKNINTVVYNDNTINILSMSYFSPRAWKYDGTLWFTEEDETTYSIHHFNGGWINEELYLKLLKQTN
jgi:hypothetical protein